MDIFKNILPSRLIEVIEKTGISTKQIITFSMLDIKKITHLKYEDIMIVKNVVNQYFCPVILTGDKLGNLRNKLKTGCSAIDNILDGGFRRGTLTEVYGESGAGKTQLVMQTAAHCGDDGSVFICTEDLFPVKRFNQIKTNICGKQNTGCNNMFIEHLTEAHELMSCIRVRLPKLLNTNKVSLLVLDSIAAPFRFEYTNYVQRAEDIKELGITLYKCALKYNIAIVCINQVTSSFDNSDNVLPSLGLAWSNMVSYKLKIKKSSDVGYSKSSDPGITIKELKVVNAPDLPVENAKFIITANGIENI